MHVFHTPAFKTSYHRLHNVGYFFLGHTALQSEGGLFTFEIKFSHWAEVHPRLFQQYCDYEDM